MRINNFIFSLIFLLLILPLMTKAFIFRPFFSSQNKPLTFERGIFLPACEPPPPTPSCSLSASPAQGQAPLNVNFNLSWSNCVFVISYSWNGPCSLQRISLPSRFLGPIYCSYTYNTPGTYGPYTANLNCSNGSTSCSSPRINVTPPPFDLSVTQFDIRSFICKNNSYDTSYINDYLSRNPNYLFPPSTTAATEYATKIEKGQPVLTCFETQRNRPTEFYAKGECLSGNCPSSKLRIYVRPRDNQAQPFETLTRETAYNSFYPKTLKEEYIFDNPYDYLATACLVKENNETIVDLNPTNNCKEQIVRVYDYYCRLGFCAESQRDYQNPPLYEKILRIFGTTDSPCRFWKNEICRARFGF